MFKRSFLRSESALKKALVSYPVYAAPFVGHPKILTKNKAEANLIYLLENKELRISYIAELLRIFDIEILSVRSGDNPQVFLDQLHGWIKREWPAIFDPKLANFQLWLASSRSGDEIVFSMLIDLAIVLGQLVIDRRPQYSWQLDLDDVNRRDDMLSVNRPVVQHERRSEFPEPIIFDFELLMVTEFFKVSSPLFGKMNSIARVIQDAISGAHESFWLDKGAE